MVDSGIRCCPSIADEWTQKIESKSKNSEGQDVRLDGLIVKIEERDDPKKPGKKKDLIVVADSWERNPDDSGKEAWNELVTRLVENQKDTSAFGIVYVHYNTKDARKQSKLLLVNWNNNSGVKEKMKYSSSKDTVKKAFRTLTETVIQADDKDDVEYEEVVKKASKGDYSL